MKKDKALSESLEDYLEIILKLEQEQKVARAKDIADRMGVQRGSSIHSVGVSVTSSRKRLRSRLSGILSLSVCGSNVT